MPVGAAGVIDRLRFRLLLILPLGLAACAQTGDFGRPKAGVWNDVVLPAAGAAVAARRNEPVSSFPFTDAEEELRDRAWRFLMPPHEPTGPRSWFDGQVADFARTRVLPASAGAADRAAYYRDLVGADFVSPASRFRRIGEDAEADLLLIDPFAANAAAVFAADEARLRSLAYVRDLDAADTADAAARVRENRCLVAWVRLKLRDRTASYRYALEHAFIAMPQGEAVEAERAVAALERHRQALDGLPVADCIGRPGIRRVPARPVVAKG